MTSHRKVFARSSALAALLVALACHHESDTHFDDSRLPGAAAASGGSNSTAGAGAQPASGGTGSLGDGGSAAGAGDTDTGGSAAAGGDGAAGTAPVGGSGGVSEGGTAGMAGGGSGAGGKPPDPEPVTITITDIADAHVGACSPYQNFGDSEKLLVDGNSGCRYLTLIDPALEKIPAGAQIVSANLELTCSNAGDPINVSYVEGTWAENSVRWMESPDVGAMLTSFTCAQVGRLQIDLSVAVKAWLAGEHHAYGVYLQSTGTNGTDFVSSEGDDAEERPALVVTYKPKK